MISLTKSSYTSFINDLVDKALEDLSPAAFKVFISAYRNIFGYGKKLWGWLANTLIKDKTNLSDNTIRKALKEVESKGFIKVFTQKINGILRQYIFINCEENQDLLERLEKNLISLSELEAQKISFIKEIKLAKKSDLESQKMKVVTSKFEGTQPQNLSIPPAKFEGIKTNNKTNILNKTIQTNVIVDVDDKLKNDVEELIEKVRSYISPFGEKLDTLKSEKIRNDILNNHDPEKRLEAYKVQLKYLSFREVKSSLVGVYIASINGNWDMPKNFVDQEIQEKISKDSEKYLPLVKIWDKYFSDNEIQEANAIMIIKHKLSELLNKFKEASRLDQLDLGLSLIEKISKTIPVINILQNYSRAKEVQDIYDRYSELIAVKR